MSNEKQSSLAYFILGLLICIGLVASSYIIVSAVLQVKSMERTVTVKGLSEKEVNADIAIWPIKFRLASNNLEQLYSKIERQTSIIKSFLERNGFKSDEISTSTPSITDKKAQDYGGSQNYPFRYTAAVVVTVYTKQIDNVIKASKNIIELGKKGIVISGNDYDSRTEFLFTGLNKIKPTMIEEATKNARKAAEKFAKDSNSILGKIKRARQGQFSITNRDKSTPYIKKIRVVTTVEYYLSD
jgi:hypothetical protein